MADSTDSAFGFILFILFLALLGYAAGGGVGGRGGVSPAPGPSTPAGGGGVSPAPGPSTPAGGGGVSPAPGPSTPGTAPVTPPANLNGMYTGRVKGENGSSAAVTLDVSGGAIVSGTVTLGSGLTIDLPSWPCFGGQKSVGAPSFAVSGNRDPNSVNPSTGEDNYALTSPSFRLPKPNDKYTATVTIGGHLTGDGKKFSGRAALDTDAGWPFEGCGDTTFSFSANA